MSAVIRVDTQKRSVWLEDGRRLGFAAARREGIDVEAEAVRLTQPGLLPRGTRTPHGVIVRASYTAYELEDGSFVAFSLVHGPYRPASPLVVLS